MRNHASLSLLVGIALVFPAIADDNATPVLVELFTSQGCSSCPPADAFLQQLTDQPVDGVEIIPVSWHVDYWNRLGWTDPYSSEAATARQQKYARGLNARGLYTPQMVVDGREEFVGSDQRRGIAAIKSAAKRRKVALELTVEKKDGSVRVVATTAQPSAGDDWRVILALTEDGVRTAVERGENRGRTLQHTGVVRGSTSMEPSGSGTWTQSIPAPKDAGQLTVVVIVQDGSGRVVAVDLKSIGD